MRIAAAFLLMFLVAAPAPVTQGTNGSNGRALSGLEWRLVGPAMFAGRVADVAGVPGNPDILYVGAASSGLYKSVNGGVTFDPIFETGNTLSIGAIAVQADKPDVVYVGTGRGRGPQQHLVRRRHLQVH